MIELELHAPGTSSDAVLEEIAMGLSPPSSYSLEEEGARLPIPGAAGLKQLLEGSGCYLWSEDSMYEVSFSGEEILLFVISSRIDVVYDLSLKLGRLEILFAYACDQDERAHRNRISRKMDYGVHEAWVGRDYSKHLPGIYWITLIPVVLQQRLGISVDGLRGASKEVSLVENRNWFVRLYDNPDAWAQDAHRIDAWCEGAAGVFRKSLAVKALEQAKNFIEASDVIADWS